MIRSKTRRGRVVATPRAAGALLQYLTDMLFQGVGTIVFWHQRANERHRLSMLGCHALKDIGLRRTDVKRECAKPFWRG